MMAPGSICNHNFILQKKSNFLQLDEESKRPLRMCLYECRRCHEQANLWVYIPESELDEIKTGKSCLLKWEDP